MASVLLVLLTGAFLALAGLVWDGGRAINGRQHAADLAEQGARAGANDLDVNQLRANGTYALNQTAAIRDACHYVTVAAPSSTCTATATASSVTVHVSMRTTTAVLGIVGITSLSSHGSATATAVQGLTTTTNAAAAGEGSRP